MYNGYDCSMIMLVLKIAQWFTFVASAGVLLATKVNVGHDSSTLKLGLQNRRNIKIIVEDKAMWK